MSTNPGTASQQKIVKFASHSHDARCRVNLSLVFKWTLPLLLGCSTGASNTKSSHPAMERSPIMLMQSIRVMATDHSRQSILLGTWDHQQFHQNELANKCYCCSAVVTFSVLRLTVAPQRRFDTPSHEMYAYHIARCRRHFTCHYCKSFIIASTFHISDSPGARNSGGCDAEIARAKDAKHCLAT